MNNWKLNKAFLLIMSYLFYAAWNPPFVIILWVSTIIDWFCAKNIYRSDQKGIRRFFLCMSLVSNLGMLAFFKYAGFFAENMNGLFLWGGSSYHISLPSIVLPVGISFYTFQTLSYTFDVYKKKMCPAHSFLDYALYVTFFPQLVAGPIVRAIDFVPQCESPRRATSEQIGWGFVLFVIGLFNKVVIADSFMSPIVETVFDGTGTPDFFCAWAGVLAFAIQIFCDFAGYSTCAIGIALTLGFYLTTNFRFPYAAVGFSDFWTRWHISLSSWLRDYLYVTLGGNRKGKARTYINLMITMLLGGLWHGASWLFVIWGGLHGLFLIIEKAILRLPIAQKQFWQRHMGQIVIVLITFCCICYTWVFFRAKSLSRAIDIVVAMTNVVSGFSDSSTLWLPTSDYIIVGVCTVAILVIHYLMRHKTLEMVAHGIPWWMQSVIMSFMIYAIITSLSGEDRAFIYFQF